MSITCDAEFPSKLQALFQPRRFKVLFGGRGAGRSWGVARALLLLGTRSPIRVLCVRELQNSIAESVHKLLSDQIGLMGLGQFYEIQVGKIIGRNGTTFSFDGIKNNTTKIKSYEGIDYCWVEEANKVSQSSWGILIPTIRKEKSEIWMTFNPELETDYTYQRFVLSPSLDSFVIKMTWKDNPWFSQVLRAEMEDLKARDYDAFLNVWEGHPLRMLEGVVFAKELRRAEEEGRIGRVPWDRESPVDTFWDLGRGDSTAIWFAQRVAMENRVVDYFEASGEDISFYLQELQSRGYTYGTTWLPHDAKAKTLGSKRSVEETVRATGPCRDVRIVKKLSIPDRVNAGRMIFPTCWFDSTKCADGLARLRRYRFEVVGYEDGGKRPIYSREPRHDENSHGADAFQYMGVSLRAKPEKGGYFQRLARASSEGQFGLGQGGAPGARTKQGWMG